MLEELPVKISIVEYETEEQKDVFLKAVGLINDNLTDDVFEIVENGDDDQVGVSFVDTFENAKKYGETITFDHEQIEIFVRNDLSEALTLNVMIHELGHSMGMAHANDEIMHCFTDDEERDDSDWYEAFSGMRTWFAINYLQ